MPVYNYPGSVCEHVIIDRRASKKKTKKKTFSGRSVNDLYLSVVFYEYLKRFPWKNIKKKKINNDYYTYLILRRTDIDPTAVYLSTVDRIPISEHNKNGYQIRRHDG